MLLCLNANRLKTNLIYCMYILYHKSIFHNSNIRVQYIVHYLIDSSHHRTSLFRWTCHRYLPPQPTCSQCSYHDTAYHHSDLHWNRRYEVQHPHVNTSLLATTNNCSYSRCREGRTRSIYCPLSTVVRQPWTQNKRIIENIRNNYIIQINVLNDIWWYVSMGKLTVVSINKHYIAELSDVYYTK